MHIQSLQEKCDRERRARAAQRTLGEQWFCLWRVSFDASRCNILAVHSCCSVFHFSRNSSLSLFYLLNLQWLLNRVCDLHRECARGQCDLRWSASRVIDRGSGIGHKGGGCIKKTSALSENLCWSSMEACRLSGDDVSRSFHSLRRRYNGWLVDRLMFDWLLYPVDWFPKGESHGTCGNGFHHSPPPPPPGGGYFSLIGCRVWVIVYYQIYQ